MMPTVLPFRRREEPAIDEAELDALAEALRALWRVPALARWRLLMGRTAVKSYDAATGRDGMRDLRQALARRRAESRR